MRIKDLNPAKQGQFDSYCSFYSICNSLVLLFPNIDKAEIFDVMFTAYIKKYNDCGATDLIYGIYRTKLNYLLKSTIRNLALPVTIKRPFWSRKATKSEAFLDKIRDLQCPPDSAMILGYEFGLETEKDYFSHWTVIRKITDKSLLTFDSDNELSRIPLKRCRIWDDDEYSKDRPYRLSSTDVFLISKHKE